MRAIFKKIVFGKAAVSEYVTVTVPEIQEKVTMSAGNCITDISSHQWLLCLDPIVLGVWVNEEKVKTAVENAEKIVITFSAGKNKKAAAVMETELIESIPEANGTLYLLKAIKSRLQHINPFSLRLLYSKHYKKPQWPFDKYASLVAAYSYPRKVRLISFKEEDYFNIFPMDLLGAVPQSNRFVFGLRHTNTALSKIIKSKKIVVCEIASAYKDIIYQLGKHHSSGPPSLQSLPFDTVQTDQFGFYIPAWTENYKEITISKTIDLGSHMLLWGEVENEKQLAVSAGSLFHIHFLESVYLEKNGINYQPV
jgi:flavin reductase (DIM6/NTAB) family NADH-FMN oxidoreductase RutF